MSIKKIAAVTGSARGIGNATAKALAEEGYLVILSDIREPEQAVDLINEFTACGYEVDYMKCNIADPQSRTAFFHEIHRKYGRLDVLVNNAGVAPKERLDVLETTTESFDFVLGTNLKGTFFMCQEAAKLLLQLKQSSPEDYKPRIVNISSCSAYGASLVQQDNGEICFPILPELHFASNIPQTENRCLITGRKDAGFSSFYHPVRPIPQRDCWFETVWADYEERTKGISQE